MRQFELTIGEMCALVCAAAGKNCDVLLAWDDGCNSMDFHEKDGSYCLIRIWPFYILKNRDFIVV